MLALLTLLIPLLLLPQQSVGPAGPTLGGSGSGGGGGGAADEITAGTTDVTSCGTGFVLYQNSSGKLSCEAALQYDAAGNVVSVNGAAGGASTVSIGPSSIESEGTTADTNELAILFGDHTGDATLTLTANTSPSRIHFDASSGFLFDFQEPISILTAPTGDPSIASACSYGAGGFVCEGSTANGFEVTFNVADPTGDTTFSLPAWATGSYNVTGYQSGTADPAATCTVGQLYYETDTAEGYACVATNTWDLMGASGSGSVTSVATDDQEFTVTDPTAAAVIARKGVYAAGNITGATTLNWNNGITQLATLTGNVTLTLSNPLNGGLHTLILVQDGTGSRTMTWPGSVVWPGGSAPALNSAAGAVTVIDFTYNGTSYYGRMPGDATLAGKWSNMTDPDQNLVLDMDTTETSFEWGIINGAGNGFALSDRSDNVGTGALLHVATDAASTMLPVRFLAGSDGVSMSAAGVLAPVASGQINANRFNGNADVAIADGGTGQSTATAGFNALDPLTTKGDIVVHDGTNSIRVAVGTNGHVLTADSAQTAGVKWAAASGGVTDVQVYTSGSGTWTKPAGAMEVCYYMIGGGGGGGSGRRGAAGTARVGGGGGGSGGVNQGCVPASALSATESYVVGAGGTGGAAQTSNDASGSTSSGSTGSTFAFWRAGAGSGGSGGGNGSGGTGGAAATSGYGAGIAGAAASTAGNAGANGSSSAIGSTSTSGGGGGSGGGITTGDAASNGGTGGNGAFAMVTPPAGGTAGTSCGNGGDGTASPTSTQNGGGGGGGGASCSSGAAGNGGAGGSYGAGGGGGGGSLNGNNSGAGGNGANGIVIVISKP